MPLPAKGAPWPPIPAEIRCDLDDWSAWYSSNPDKIADRYWWRSTRAGQYGQPANRPSQHRGGIVGGIARFFWGEPTPMGERRVKLHVPLPADIARTSSDLLFSEAPALKADDKSTQERLEDLMEFGLKRTLIGAGELSAALGGVYPRVTWDDRIGPRPWISTVHADAAAPEFLYDRLLAVTFWTVLEIDGQRVVRHLERHEPGVILHGVYEGGPQNLGRPIDLGAFSQTKGLQAVRELPIKTLAVSYVPNTMVARGWRDVPGSGGLGESDFQGSELLFDALDETLTSWMRDVRLAKSRIILPDGYLQSNGPGRGVSWEDREVYAGMSIPPTSDEGITLNQFLIRHAEHKATMDELIGKVIRNAGYNGSTFGDDSEGPAITATEVKARQGRSMSTRSRKSELYAVGVSSVVETLLALEASGMFPGVKGVPVERPKMIFQDSVQDDLATLAQTALTLRQAEAASTEAIVALVHPDWDEAEQETEVQRILAESGRSVADPMAVGAEGAADADLAGAGGGPGPAGP